MKRAVALTACIGLAWWTTTIVSVTHLTVTAVAFTITAGVGLHRFAVGLHRVIDRLLPKEATR